MLKDWSVDPDVEIWNELMFIQNTVCASFIIFSLSLPVKKKKIMSKSFDLWDNLFLDNHGPGCQMHAAVVYKKNKKILKN